MRIVLLPLVAALLLTVPVAAGDDEVYVYTNADLEQLEPIPGQQGTPPTAEEIERGWAFVQSVIDDAHARIDADRQYDLDRRKTEAEADALDRIGSRPRYALPYNYRFGYPQGGYGYGRGGGRGGDGGRASGDPLRRQASRLWDPPNAHLFRPIVPIHARPYQTNILRLKANRPGLKR
jgi:hypothetical protein